MFIPDPYFYPFRIPYPRSRIPDPKTATKERGETNLLSHLFCSHRFHKIENYLFFKFWAMGLGSGIRDPGSGKKPIPDPRSRIWIRVKKAPDPGSGSATLKKPVMRIRISWIHMILGLLDPDPDPLVGGTDPDPSIFKQKNRKTLLPTVL